MNIYLTIWMVLAAFGVLTLTYQWAVKLRPTGDYIAQMSIVIFVWFLMWGAGVFTLL